MSQVKTFNQTELHHTAWVRVTHWLVTLSFFSLLFSGFVILMCHPRLYWGEVGNDLTPAILELPISRNYQHNGWSNNISFFSTAASPVSASRTYEIFNENGWGRSLHFLSAWVLVLTGVSYIIAAFARGHFGRYLWPDPDQFTINEFKRDLVSHLRLKLPPATTGPTYGLLQKCSYLLVILILLPLIAVTGLTMSPAVTAGFPFLLKLFGGYQSARTIHFFCSAALLVFVLVHVGMVIKTGFRQHLRAMTIGK